MKNQVVKSIKRNLKNRNFILFLIAITLTVLGFVFIGMIAILSDNLTEQQMAKRWSKKGGVAHVSCFYSEFAAFSEDSIQEFEYKLDKFLAESSIVSESTNPGARLWVDAYSAEGQITLKSERASLDADAFGVGGDYFLFHPQKLLYGSYFSGNDLNQDYCVIDEDAAWQLFGSSNVAGMTVSISGVPHIVSGVIERPTGKLYQAAGLDTTRVYVSYQTMDNYGNSHGINHYEIVMPNPVKEFAYNYVKEQLGSDERESEIVENSKRFSLLNRLKRLKGFATRSMNGRAIIYPYWENLARGYEDIIGVLTLMSVIVFIYPVIFAVICFRHWWKHKGWTFKSICIKIRDRIEKIQEERYYKKNRE